MLNNIKPILHPFYFSVFEVVVPIRVPSRGQIEILNHLLYLKSLTVCKQKINVKLNYLYYISMLQTI